MDEDKLCPHCGAKIKKYPHGLSKSLGRTLRKLAEAGGGPVSIANLELSKGEYTNFAKLAYWDLVEKANPSGHERGGIWKLTFRGHDFVRGKGTVRRKAWVYRGDVVEREGELVGIDDVTGGWKYKPHYAREGRPRDDDDQFQVPLI